MSAEPADAAVVPISRSDDHLAHGNRHGLRPSDPRDRGSHLGPEFPREHGAPPGSTGSLAPPDQEPEGAQADPRLQKVREAAAKLSQEHMWLDADVLEQDSLFKSTVADLSRPEVDASAALKAAKSSSDFEAAIGFAALAARAEIPSGQTDWALRALRRCSDDLERFVFRMLARHAEYPVIGADAQPAGRTRQLGRSSRSSSRSPRGRRGDHCGDLSPERAPKARTQYRKPPRPLRGRARARFRARLRRLASDDGRYGVPPGIRPRLGAPLRPPPALLVGRRRELVELVLGSLEQVPRRSVLLVGEPGVGKTALARAAVERLPAASSSSRRRPPRFMQALSTSANSRPRSLRSSKT